MKLMNYFNHRESFGLIWKIIICLTLIQSCQGSGTYSVVGPRVIRPNSDYSVVVCTHATVEPLSVTVEVGGGQHAGGVILNQQTAQLQPEQSQVLKFKIGELGSGVYNLTVTGSGGINFRNSTQLEYIGKSNSVFIQTDRAVYKPGDVMQFRVVVLNQQLRPSVTGAIDVFIRDGNGNRVKQWRRVFTNKGVWSGSLHLSEEPVLGQWNITVNVLGQTTLTSVFVANYILPKFEVIVDLPKYATFEDELIMVTVKARYSYGRAVRGELTLQVTPTYKYDYLQAPYQDPIRVVKQMKGKTDVPLRIVQDLKLQGDYTRQLEITAFVQDEMTGRVQNATEIVSVYRYPYTMELIRTSDTFKPGLKYTAFLKIATHDGTPMREGEVAVRHAFSHHQEDFIETIHKVPRTGVVPLEFFPPLDEDANNNLALEAQYGNLTQWLGDLTRSQSPSNSFLQVTILTPDPAVGDEIIVGLNATQRLVYFVYKVLGRGDVLFAQTLQAHRGTTHTFRFIASARMAPRARILVYYITGDGEIVADALHFNVKGAIQNPVTVSVSPGIVDAGEDVSITVTTKPNAFVGIAAIDQRSLQMGSGNQLTEDSILRELDDYDPGYSHGSGLGHRRRRRSLYNDQGSTTAADVFKNVGVVVLTNGLLYDFNPYVLTVYPRGDGPIDGSVTESILSHRRAINGPFGRKFAPLDATATLRPDLGPGLEYNAPPRPPLAGPYAFSFLPPPPDDGARVYLNQYIPETWLFKDTETRFNGVATIKEKAPDSITSYVVSAFAVDDFHGLGVASEPAKLTVFRPFFVSVHLPSSVVRGEAVAVEMVVFNYQDVEVSAEVVLFNDGYFLFPDFANELDQASPAAERRRRVTVPANDGTALSFMIIPQTLGSVPIKVTALSGQMVDRVTKKLLVKPEGTKLTINKAMLVDVRDGAPFKEIVKVTLPRNIVNDSYSISVSVIGDVLGAAVSDLSSLIELPTGCGEQNMAKLMPNIVLVEYLKRQSRLSEGLVNQARVNMETGYQRQLTFKHPDGSFSAFGKKDKSGSSWLTAFVAKTLWAASRHIDVDVAIIQEAVNWLIETQQIDGSFREVGVINNEAIQGGATEGVPLTAYVLIALLEVKDAVNGSIQNPINRAVDFLAIRIEQDQILDTYSLAIVTYVLHLAKHPHRDTAFYQLESKAEVADEKKWWQSAGPLLRTAETTASSRSLDVELTSYALLTYNIRGLTKDALPILRWLTGQRNQAGGFQSTQDTAVGMAALAALGERLSSPNPSINIRLIYGARGKNIQVTRNNALITQKFELPDDTEEVTVSGGGGGGVAVVQITYSYNVQVTAPNPAFSLDTQLDRTTDANKLRLTTCTGYTAGNASNMAVMDVDLPSGYILDNNLIPGLYDYPSVKRAEMKSGGRGVLIYFDSLTENEVCPTVAAYRVAKVAFQKPTAVKVYDYYDLSRQARRFYSAAPATLCDICDLDECDPLLCEEQILQLSKQQQDFDEFTYPAIVEEIPSLGIENCTPTALWLLLSIFHSISYFL